MRSTVRPRAALIVSALVGAITACGGGQVEFDTGQFEIAEDLTLTYWAQPFVSSSTSDYLALNEAYRELERVTGIHVDFTTSVTEDPARQLEQLKAADDLPDIIEWSWRVDYPGGPVQAVNDGLIIALDDLIPTHAPNFFELLRSDEGLARSVNAADGTMYAFPHLLLDPEVRARSGPVFRAEWLDAVGMPVPETMDEWTDILRAFRDGDMPTIQEQHYPFMFITFRQWMEERLIFLFLLESNLFAGAFGTTYGFVDGGARRGAGRSAGVEYGPVTPEYRDMLAALNDWFEQGLIHPSLAAPEQNRNILREIGASGGFVGGVDATVFLSPLNLVPVPPPRGDSPRFYGAELVSAVGPNRSAAVSADCAHPAEAVRWLDVGYSEWGRVLFNYGVEGSTYERQRGSPVLLEEVTTDLRTAVRGSDLYKADLLLASRGVYGGPFVLEPEIFGTVYGLAAAGSPDAFNPNPWVEGAFTPADSVVRLFPDLVPEYGTILESLQQHVMRSFAEFVSGRRPLDEFDSYVRELRTRRVDRAIEIIETAQRRFASKPLF